jgi:hypothetical protein
LSGKFGAVRVEAASRRAVAHRAFSYRSIKSILDKGLDKVASDGEDAPRPLIEHENVRGAAYYAAASEEAI